MDYVIKQIDKSQLINLKKLFEHVYYKNAIGLLGLEERFNTTKFGASFIGYLAYPKVKNYDGEIEIPAAYYGVFPQIAIHNNIQILCAQSGETMTHQLHRGKGLFVKLAQLTNEMAKNKGIEFIYGFPSPSSYPGFLKKLNWEFPYNMLTFNKFIPTFPIGLIKRKIKIPIGNLEHLNFFLKKMGFEDCKSIVNLDFDFDFHSNSLSILRSEDYLFYKTQISDNKRLIRSEDTCFLIKYDGDIKIGEIMGKYTYSSIDKIMKKIEILAFITGSCRVHSFFSPHSKYVDLLGSYGSIKEAMPFGYLNLLNKINPSKLDLKFIDYDYF